MVLGPFRAGGAIRIVAIEVEFIADLEGVDGLAGGAHGRELHLDAFLVGVQIDLAQGVAPPLAAALRLVEIGARRIVGGSSTEDGQYLHAAGVHQFHQIEKQVGRSLAEAIAKPPRMDPRDPVHHGDPARLEVAGFVVVGGQEGRDLGLLRPGQRPLRPHIGPVDAELHRRGHSHAAALGQNGERAQRGHRDGPPHPRLRGTHTLSRINHWTSKCWFGGQPRALLGERKSGSRRGGATKPRTPDGGSSRSSLGLMATKAARR